MKSILAFAGLIFAAFGLSACAEVDNAVDFVNAPKTQQAAATLEKGATALVCPIANGAAAAGQLEAAINAGQSVKGTDGKIYAASSIVCASLGGKITGSGTVQ